MKSEVTEDLDLFLQDLLETLNKYHYGISPFEIVLFIHEGIKTIGFVADGKLITPQYVVPEKEEE